MEKYLWNESVAMEDVKHGQRRYAKPRNIAVAKIAGSHDDWTLVDSCKALTEGNSVKELLEDLMQEWKTKLETIACEGYDKMLINMQMENGEGEKREMFEAWESQFVRDLGETQKRVEILNQTTIKEAREIIAFKVTIDKKMVPDFNRNKKTIVNMEFDTANEYGSFQQLLRDLDKVCNLLQFEPRVKTLVPIYQPKPRINVLPSVAARTSLPPKISSPFRALEVTPTNHKEIRNIIKGTKKESCGSPIIKDKATQPQGKFKIEGGRCNSFRFVQFERNGRPRYFIIKRNEKSVRQQEEVEDIFNQWLTNFQLPTLKRKIQPRTRKLSHRSMRKKVIRAALQASKPRLYSDAVKKNLREAIQPEDIFESWLVNMAKLEMAATAAVAAGKDRVKMGGEQFEDFFKVWRHNLLTERVENKRSKPAADDVAPPAAKLARSDPRSEVSRGQKRNYEREVIFSRWRDALFSSEKAVGSSTLTDTPPYENIFNDWIGNLQTEEVQTVPKAIEVMSEERLGVNKKQQPTSKRGKRGRPAKH